MKHLHTMYRSSVWRGVSATVSLALMVAGWTVLIVFEGIGAQLSVVAGENEPKMV